MFGIDDAAIGLIASGALSSAGSLYANKKNIELQHDVNDQSIRLANTAHQREVRDLLAAGLNPILSAHGSGASVPSLGAVSIQNPGEGISDGIKSASSYLSEQYKEQVALTRANTAMADEATTAAALNNELLKSEAEVRSVELENESIEAQLYNKNLKKKAGVDESNFDSSIISDRKGRYERSHRNWRFKTGENGTARDNLIQGGIESRWRDAKYGYYRSWLPFIGGGINSLVNGLNKRKGN